jgi:hypothetical protein
MGLAAYLLIVGIIGGALWLLRRRRLARSNP